MGDYLIHLFFGPVPKAVRGKVKLVVLLIRISEALIFVGLLLPWYTTGLGVTYDGIKTDSGLPILIILIAGNIFSWWRPIRWPMSRYAWVMALLAIAIFMMTYTESGGDPDDRFVRELGAYVTMAGAFLRFALGAFLGRQIQREEMVMILLGLKEETLATRGTFDTEHDH